MQRGIPDACGYAAGAESCMLGGIRGGITGSTDLALITVPAVPSCVTMTRMRSIYAVKMKSVGTPPTSAAYTFVLRLILFASPTRHG